MITSKIKIKESVSKVWQALTDKNQMKEWYFDIPDFELKTGAVFNFYEPGEAKQFHHRCRILEIVPEKKFSHTWTHPGLSKGESVGAVILPADDMVVPDLLEQGTRRRGRRRRNRRFLAERHGRISPFRRPWRRAWPSRAWASPS